MGDNLIELPFNAKKVSVDGLRKRKFDANRPVEEQFSREHLERIQNAVHFTKVMFPGNAQLQSERTGDSKVDSVDAREAQIAKEYLNNLAK